MITLTSNASNNSNKNTNPHNELTFGALAQQAIATVVYQYNAWKISRHEQQVRLQMWENVNGDPRLLADIIG